MLSAISNFAGSVINGVMQPIMEQLSFEHNKQLQDSQNLFNLDMWHMQNEYNSPQAQMKRFADAGLNPNLIYGQGTSGNASSAPYQTSRVEAPHFGKAAEALAKVFNIEELRTLVAHRKQEEAKATEAMVSAADAKDRRAAMKDFGELYAFDPEKGQFVIQDLSPDNSVTVTRPMSREQRRLERETGSYSNRGFFFQQARADDYTKRALIPYRQKLLGSQNSYLQPQIWMSNFERSHYPVSYWIGQGTKAVHGLSEFTGMFNPSRYLMPMRSSGYFTPFGKYFIDP